VDYSAPATYGGGTVNGSLQYSALGNAITTSSVASATENDEVFLTVVRQFVSRGLKPEKSYRFELRAELEATDGETIVESKTVVVTAGTRESIQFAFAGQDKTIQTALILNVPEGAEVELAGQTTTAVGETRTFRTSRLKPGEVWDNYEVQVRLGDEVKQKSIRLIAGDQLRLTFAFDESADRLASR
jgi:uncharacterized protein (TIGR03000 family)